MNIWQELSEKSGDEPFFALAPMEDVTDVVFRQVVARASRPDVFFTEFMNVSGFCHPQGRESVARRLRIGSSRTLRPPTDAPIVAQIWGNDPEKFSLTAKELRKMGFAGIDINMGCPDKAVVKSGGGAALIANPNLAVAIIDAARSSAAESYTTPISVKTRIGYSNPDEYENWLSVLLHQNLAALTVHLRTKKEMSKVPAHYELIPEIVKLRDKISPHTKLIINGDIADRSAGLNLIKKYPGIDGIMIGRGVFANPYCFEKEPKKHSQTELENLLKYHLDLVCADSKYKIQNTKYNSLKKFFKIYINNFPGAKELRAELMETKNAGEALKLL